MFTSECFHTPVWFASPPECWCFSFRSQREWHIAHLCFWTRTSGRTSVWAALPGCPGQATGTPRAPTEIHEDALKSDFVIQGHGVSATYTVWLWVKLNKLWHLRERGRRFSQKYSILLSLLLFHSHEWKIPYYWDPQKKRCSSHSFSWGYPLTLMLEAKFWIQILNHAALSRGKSGQCSSTSVKNPDYDF